MRLMILSCRKNAAYYTQFLEQHEVDFDLLCEISLITHLPFAVQEYSGVMIEEAALINVRQGDESLLELIRNVIPTIDIQTHPGVTHNESEDLKLETFLEACQLFPPRSVRLQDRVNIELLALVSTNKCFANSWQSTTINLSKSGCLLTNSPRLATGDKLWVRFVGFDDSSPVLCEVRRVTEPQSASNRCEVGVRFLEVEPSQLEKLHYVVLEGMLNPN
jgi:hypothetical protein